MEVVAGIMKALWVGGLAATPLILLVGMICRVRSVRPATRHLLWTAVLVSFVTPVLGSWLWRPEWFRTERLIAAADSAIDHLKARATEPGAPASPSARPAEHLLASTASGKSKIGPTSRPDSTPMDLMPGAAPWIRSVLQPDSASGRLALAEGMTAPVLLADASPRETAQATLGTTAWVNPSTPSYRNYSADATCPIAPVGPGMSAGLIQSESGGRRPQYARLGPDSVRPSTPSAAAPVPVQAPTTPVEVAPVPAASALDSLRVMIAKVVVVRDSIAALPPIPTALWLGGTALLLAMRVGRTVRAKALLRRAQPAGPQVRILVARLAERMNLRRVPEALMVDAPISPMIWCGLTPRLVLPRGLWESLDEDSKTAVIVHEFAHLRRLDHLLCWVELVIGALYWWHPLAWWARKRLRDEAEASCDAWVTNTLPSSRRAYAVALVAAKSYLSLEGSGAGKGPWLGVVSGSARRLARRITMVMTQRTIPNMSIFGACVAATVVALGTFVMPGIACPPESAGEKDAKILHAGNGVVVVQSGDKKKGEGDAFFGEAPALEAMKKKGRVFVVPDAPSAPGAPAPALAPMPPMAPMAPMVRLKKSGDSGKCGSSRGSLIARTESGDPRAGRVGKVYRLPEGKAEAFWVLLSRSDVPVFVERRSGDSIMIYAREEQHPTIGAFIEIISPKGSASGGGSQSRKMRSGNLAELGAYQESLRQLELNRATLEQHADAAREHAEQLREQHEHLQEMNQQLREHAGAIKEGQARKEFEAAASQLRHRSDAVRDQARASEQQVKQLERQLNEIQKRAEKLEERLSRQHDEDGDDEDDQDEIDESDMDIAGDAMMVELDDVAPEMLEVPDEIGAPEMEVPDEVGALEGAAVVEEDETPVAPEAPEVAPVPEAAPAAAPASAPAPVPAPAPSAVPAPVAAPSANPIRAT